jgi:two-component system chemotaxis response regulator CheY
MPGKILVVEDNESIRSIVRMTLEHANHDVLEAENGGKAVEFLKRERDIDLVITDLAMPVLDGFGLLDFIRKEQQNTHLPVFVLSAEKDAGDAGEHGATRIIRKPFSPIGLLEMIDGALKKE